MSGSADVAAPAAALEVVRRYIGALNRRDVDGVRAAFHFPHVLLGRGEVNVYATPADYDFGDFDRHTAGDGWVRSTWDEHRAVHAGADKVHLDVAFTRWRADGSAIGTHRSLYVLVRLDGRWGLQARSSFG